jgi:putative phosphoesterase
MRIGVISDTHGRIPIVLRTAHLLGERGIEIVLHCGDIDDAATVRHFEGFTTHFVYGNNDDDRQGIRAATEQIGGTMHEPYGALELDGRKIAFLHGDDWHLMSKLERSGEFDYLFYGHTHHRREHVTGPTRVINPGALHRARPKTFLVLDLASGDGETVIVE